MKNSLKFLALAAIAVLAAVSCQKNELRDSNSEDLFFSLRTSDTKTYMVSNPDGSFSPNWNNGDEIGVFFEDFASNKETPAGKLSNSNDSGATAKFEGTISSAGESGTIYAFYPASALGKTYANQNVGFDMPSIQHPTATSFDPAADILVAKPVDYIAEGGNVIVDDMQFARILAILKVELNSSFSAVQNQKVINFSIKSSAATLSGRPAVTLTASDGKITGWNVKNKEISAAYDKNSTVAVSGTDNNVYLTINPATIPVGEKLTFNIETEKYIITKEVTLSDEIKFTPGNLTEIKLSIAETNCEEKVIVDYSGEYLFVSGNYLMTGNAGEYFNLIKADGSTLQDFWKIEGVDDYAWTVAKTSAGNYTFYNAATDKYMALTKDDNKAYVVDDADDDTAKFTIKEEDSALTVYNVAYPGRKMRCNFGANRFAFYSSTSTTGTVATLLAYTPDTRPTFSTVSGLVWDASGKTLSWNSVEGATNGYEYTTDDGVIVTAVDANTIDCSSWFNGDYSVKVRVVGTDAQKTSEWSEACEFTITGGVAKKEFKLFTSDIEEGDYIIYYDGKAMKASVSSNRLDYVEVTPSDDKITNPDASIVWHIASSGESWTIFNESVEKYAASTGTKSQAALNASDTDDKSLWSISNTSGKFEFVNKYNKSKSVNANLRNNGTYGFACYATGTGGALTLYQLEESGPHLSASASKTSDISAAGETVTITVKTNIDGWSVSSDNTAFVVGAKSGNTVPVVISENTSTTNERTAKITVSATGVEDVVITLTQSKAGGGGTPKTVTYKQTSTSAASVSSGTAPTGSSVTFSNTYSTKEQLTKNNSMTYTLKGYAGKKITAISMSMHSNSSAGTGKFSLVAGTTTLAEIASNTGFNQSAWYGSWTQSYVTVTPTMTKTDYVIQTGEDVVLTISASANSLFCESITITYE